MTTPKLTLIIGNKNYSSWSIRPWVLLRQFDIAFDELQLKFHTPQWAARIGALSSSGMVPVLWLGAPETGDAIYESLAILETIAELFPEKNIWPKDRAARAFARSIATEMHGGFGALRMAMSVNIRARLPGLGYTAAAAKDIARIEHLWKSARTRFGNNGPFLFGQYCAADAMYAPVVTRFQTYAPPISTITQQYCDAMLASPGLAAWIAEAMRETEFLPDHEDFQSAINQLK